LQGVVTSLSGERVFITFNHGSSIFPPNHKTNHLCLGDIVDIKVIPARDDGRFNIVEVGEEIRKRDDMVVLLYQGTKCTVVCDAKVVGTCNEYFLLDTPIIGGTFFLCNDAHGEMEVGDLWKVKMQRLKHKKDFPSHWMATSVVGDKYKKSEAITRRDDMRKENAHSSRSREFTNSTLL
ncbi:hypothetical protein PMAYCL1PPCAC_19721, partial [Pristionchus mayeri]